MYEAKEVGKNIPPKKGAGEDTSDNPEEHGNDSQADEDGIGLPSRVGVTPHTWAVTFLAAVQHHQDAFDEAGGMTTPY